MKRFCATLCYLIIAISGFAQAVGDYRSTGNVTFGASSNWEVLTALPATWTAASTAPAAASLSSANTVTVLTGHTLSFPANVSFASNNDFTVLIQGAIATGGSAVSYGNGQSTVKIQRASSINYLTGFATHTFRKLVLEGTAGTPTFTFTSALKVTNSLTVINANLLIGSLILTGNTVTVNANGNITFSGTQAINTSTLSMNFTGNNRVLTFQNNLGLTGGTPSSFGVNFAGTGSTIAITGNFSSDNSLFSASFPSSSSNPSSLQISGTIDMANNSLINLTGDYSRFTISGNSTQLSKSIINLQGNNQQLIYSAANTISLSSTSYIKLLGNNGLMNLGTSSSFSGVNASNYVQLSSTSRLLRQIRNNNNFTFPIGTSNYYLPLFVNPTSGANNTNFTAGIFTDATLDATPGGTPISKTTIVDAVWILSHDANTNKQVVLNATWQSALEGSVFAGFTTLSQVGISQGVPGTTTWSSAVGGSAVDYTNNIFTSNPITIPKGTTNAFVIGQINQTLPILIKNFTANVINKNIKLQWQALATSMEGHFEVERAASQDGKFQSIGRVPVLKVGDAIYTYTDGQPLATNSYYRIRSIDENGHESLSKTIRININETPFMLNQVYPTVCRQNLNLSVNSSKADKLTVRIIDISGRLALEKHLQAGPGTNSYSLDLGRLASGQYILVLNNGEQVINSRFIRQ